MSDTVGFYASSAGVRGPDHPAYLEFLRSQIEGRTSGRVSIGPIPCRYCGQTSASGLRHGGYCCEARRLDSERTQIPDAVRMLRRHGYTVTPPEST